MTIDVKELLESILGHELYLIFRDRQFIIVNWGKCLFVELVNDVLDVDGEIFELSDPASLEKIRKFFEVEMAYEV